MTAPLATPDDLRRRWSRCPPESQDEMLTALLDDASIWIRTIYRGRIPADPDEDLASVLRLVVCATVRRSLQAEAAADGAEQITDTQGPFATSLKFRNAEGNLYLTAQEREMIDAALDGIGDTAPGIRCVDATGW